jgi:hypothetical protein
MDLNFTVLPYTYTDRETCRSFPKFGATDDELKSKCFEKDSIKDDFKTVIKFTNKKLQLVLQIIKNREHQTSWFFRKKVFKQCETFGQASAQMELILKDLKDYGLKNDLIIQKQLSTEINSLVKLII